MSCRLAIGCVVLCLLGASLWAQAPGSLATQPQRKALVVPPNFKIVVGERRSVVCQEGDEAWVRQALLEAKPATMPSTMPSDLLERVTEYRDVLCERIARDLGFPDTALPRKLIDEQIIPLLRRACDFDPPVFYMVSTEEKIRDLIKNGWENPLFYYNRAADRVAINTRIELSMTDPMDDTLLPALYEPHHDFATRKALLLDAIARAEGRMAFELAVRSEYATQLAFVAFITTDAIQPLKLKADQEWFGIGLAGVLSAKYLAIVNGMEENSFVRNMVQNDPDNPIRLETIDLLNPIPADQMRQNYRRAYVDAYQRKASKVIKHWLDQLPPGGLAKTLAAIEKTAPTDGPALIELIARTTGVNLSTAVKPG
ncbi:MAG: hypothetical protein NZ561_01775 [Phycisphaerae bacterium]|nr:hypothetical protein [Phycisphaerae bacterium]MDW8262655.1 hypothetical protein [Phycisphaerales bacterium]